MTHAMKLFNVLGKDAFDAIGGTEGIIFLHEVWSPLKAFPYLLRINPLLDEFKGPNVKRNVDILNLFKEWYHNIRRPNMKNYCSFDDVIGVTEIYDAR